LADILGCVYWSLFVNEITVRLRVRVRFRVRDRVRIWVWIVWYMDAKTASGSTDPY